jgi:thioredoxin-related protein
MKYLLLLMLLVGCATTPKSVNTIDGVNHNDEKVSVATDEKKATVVIFMSARCPCSDSHTKIIKNLNQKYKDINFVGIHSNYNEKKHRARQYFANKKLGFPIIHDSESVLAKKFGAMKTPHVFIINSAGNIVYKGSVTDSANASGATVNYLDEALFAIMNNQMIPQPKRKTLGCYIPIKE